MNRTLTCSVSLDELTPAKLSQLVTHWLLHGQLSQHSPRTEDLRRIIFGKLQWFLADREAPLCTPEVLMEFLSYVGNGHRDPRGRWANPRYRKPAAPGTAATYARHLRAFFAWAVKNNHLESDLMANVPRIIDRPDDVQPFTSEQVRRLLEAARKSKESKRNYALLLFLLDTACRVSEVCAVRWQDVDLSSRLVKVEGKGGKQRLLPFSAPTGKAIVDYVGIDGRDPGDPLFEGERGGAMTRNGVRLIFARLAKTAGIQGKCSPHVMRHTSATEFLRNGGATFALQRMLGHTTLNMTRRYVDTVDADVAAQHRQASPVEGLLRKRM